MPQYFWTLSKHDRPQKVSQQYESAAQTFMVHSSHAWPSFSPAVQTSWVHVPGMSGPLASPPASTEETGSFGVGGAVVPLSFSPKHDCGFAGTGGGSGKGPAIVHVAAAPPGYG